MRRRGTKLHLLKSMMLNLCLGLGDEVGWKVIKESSSLLQTMLLLDLYSVPNVLFAGSQAEYSRRQMQVGKITPCYLALHA